ncbi:MAG: MFS transporter [Lewinellaceae bacterium]|nr:MFS transporter [Lewinellaceae bacterium]
MENINRNRLFLASCMALVVTAMTFAIRARLETVFGPDGKGLSLEQIGFAFTPAFWGFTLAMIIGGPLVDSLGMKRIMWVAFIMHAVGIVATLMASDQTSLFLATLAVGIGNGMVEAACNPLVASMYPNQKVKMLNRFHVWFPGGIVIGSVVGYLVMDVMNLSWQVMVGTLFLPLIIYGFMFLGQAFPKTERVVMGVSYGKMWASIASPLFLFMAFSMLLTAATELGTNQRIESLLKDTGVAALLVLAFINGIMALGRAFAGQVAHRLSTAGMLLFSAVFSFLGLMLLSTTSGAMTFVSALIFAVGITFFWPTMLSFVAENIPESGALGLSVMGGLGMLSTAIVLPIIGKMMDEHTTGSQVLQTMAILPGILILLFTGLNFYMRRKRAAAA